MKKIVAVTLLSSNLICSIAAADVKPIHNPDWGKHKIIFGAQYKGELGEKAIAEGLAAGGDIQGAIDKCERNLEKYEEDYKKGACKNVRELLGRHHEEGALYHAGFHILLPGMFYMAAAIGGIVSVLWLKRHMPPVFKDPHEHIL